MSFAGAGEASWRSVFVALMFLQVAAGGFVAGLDAGHASYTWPRMNEAWVPDGLTIMQPLWKNWFENALAVQFNHRLLAYVILLFAVLQVLVRFEHPSAVLAGSRCRAGQLRHSHCVVAGAAATALSHQGGALVVLALALWHLVCVTRAPVQYQQ